MLTKCLPESTTHPSEPRPGAAAQYRGAMAESLDVDAMLTRFRERAHAVKQRPLPPVAGDERARFVKQAQTDFRDFAIIGDAVGAIEDGFLVLRVDLRPPEQRG